MHDDVLTDFTASPSKVMTGPLSFLIGSRMALRNGGIFTTGRRFSVPTVFRAIFVPGTGQHQDAVDCAMESLRPGI